MIIFAGLKSNNICMHRALPHSDTYQIGAHRALLHYDVV